jgi:hypothetical protein
MTAAWVVISEGCNHYASAILRGFEPVGSPRRCPRVYAAGAGALVLVLRGRMRSLAQGGIGPERGRDKPRIPAMTVPSHLR